MKTPKALLHQQFYLYCVLLTSLFGSSQEDINVLDAYEDYTYAPREVVYLHLNKSTYVIGETIGFTAYISNKDDKKPSLQTTNLYVTIEDEKQQTLKQKLLLVNNGVASNTFEVDSTFSQGNYRIKAYTNWMRNFKEPNYFHETIRVKDQTSKAVKTDLTSNTIDAQFLPESGHLLHGVENNIGVVIKNKYGLGVSEATGEVLDKNGNVLTTFKTNDMGIGRFSLIPDSSNEYSINLTTSYGTSVVKLNHPISPEGIILSTKRLKDKVFVSAITNSSTLQSIKNKRYTLLLHNGNTADLMDIYFTDDTKVTKVLELTGSPGVNILTLFNDTNQPIAERLVFNYKGIAVIKSAQDVAKSTSYDSLSLKLNYKGIDTTKIHNISVSVLPSETKSYYRNHNIVSQTYLQPYINGAIENAKYYFTDITEKKKYELDNLLLTQGWSSYDWNTIFNSDSNYTYDFEQGIILKANYNSDDGKGLFGLVYYFDNEDLLAADNEPNKSSYIIKNIYPRSNTKIRLSEVTEKGDVKPVNLYMQYFPSQVPKLPTAQNTLQPYNAKKGKSVDEVIDENFIFQSSEKVEQLAEVVIRSNPLLDKRERRNELSSGKFGRIRVVDKEDENSYITLLNYLKFHAWNMTTNPFKGPNSTTTGVAGAAAVELVSDPFLAQTLSAGVNYFLNDILIIDYSRLEELFLSNIDYIEINRFGTSDGVRSPAGFIKIYTKDPSQRRYYERLSKAYDFPLTFSDQKKFYTPKYRYYNDDFFKDYGTIDWKPNVTVDAKGNATFKIQKPLIPVTLFIEGIANDGSFIFEEKKITID